MKTWELTQLRIRMGKPGDPALTAITNDYRAEDRALPVETMRIAWSKPTPRDHMEPTTIEFTLLVPEGSPDLAFIAYDAPIEITATINVPDRATPYTFRLAAGRVTSWRRDLRRPDGRHPYHITATDIIGRLATSSISDTPWPEQTAGDRLARISAITKSGPFTYSGPTAGTTVGPRDVDNRTALDMAQHCCPVGRHITPGAYPYNTDISIAYPAMAHPETTQPLQIPAALVEDTGRAMDRTGIVTEYAVTAHFTHLTDNPNTITYYSIRNITIPTSRATLSTDAKTTHSAAGSWTREVMNAATPAVALPDSPRIYAREEYVIPSVDQLFDTRHRHTETIWIQDAPADADPLHYIVGQEITIHGLDLQLRLTLAPGATYGLRRLTFWDWRYTSNRIFNGRRPRIGDAITATKRIRIKDNAYTAVTTA